NVYDIAKYAKRVKPHVLGYRPKGSTADFTEIVIDDVPRKNMVTHV
ncbi:unnamed protein product, partial [marine sediment metagenome]